jgi:hypothetical protein
MGYWAHSRVPVASKTISPFILVLIGMLYRKGIY